MQPAAPLKLPPLAPLTQLAAAMWDAGVQRQVRRGRERWATEMVWNEKAKRRKPEPVHRVMFVLSLQDVETLLRAWQISVQHWARLIDLWERLVVADGRDDWEPGEVQELEARVSG